MQKQLATLEDLLSTLETSSLKDLSKIEVCELGKLYHQRGLGFDDCLRLQNSKNKTLENKYKFSCVNSMFLLKFLAHS